MSVSVRWTGNTKWVPQLVNRAKVQEVEHAVMGDWQKWVLNTRIVQMYRDGGRVRGRGGQGRWAPNTADTAGGKGHSRPMLSQKNYRFGAMVRSYRIQRKRLGLRAWKWTIENRARGRDKFDYPSLLHTGGKGGRFVVRPVHAKVLRFVGAGGRVIFAHETHPKRVPKRPHLQFFGIDQRELQARMLAWIIDAQKTGKGRTRS